MGCIFAIIWLAIIASCVSLLGTLIAILVTLTWNGLLLPNNIVTEPLIIEHVFTASVAVVLTFMIIKILYGNIRKRIE